MVSFSSSNLPDGKTPIEQSQLTVSSTPPAGERTTEAFSAEDVREPLTPKDLSYKGINARNQRALDMARTLIAARVQVLFAQFGGKMSENQRQGAEHLEAKLTDGALVSVMEQLYRKFNTWLVRADVMHYWANKGADKAFGEWLQSLPKGEEDAA